MAIKYADGSDSDTGRVVQVLSCTPVLSGYWANQTDWTDLTGLAITITPKSATNKLLLRAQVHQSSAGGDYTSCIGFKKGDITSFTSCNPLSSKLLIACVNAF